MSRAEEYERLGRKWASNTATPEEIKRLRELAGPGSLLDLVLCDDSELDSVIEAAVARARRKP